MERSCIAEGYKLSCVTTVGNLVVSSIFWLVSFLYCLECCALKIVLLWGKNDSVHVLHLSSVSLYGNRVNVQHLCVRACVWAENMSYEPINILSDRLTAGYISAQSMSCIWLSDARRYITYSIQSTSPAADSNRDWVAVWHWLNALQRRYQWAAICLMAQHKNLQL